MDSYTQLTRQGEVNGWTTFNQEAEGQGAEGQGAEDQGADHDEYTYQWGTGVPLDPRSYNVVDLVVGGTMVTDLKREQCALFLSNGFYLTKAWVN